MSGSASRLRVGLVGAGAMGSLHARVVAQSQRASLAFVVDPAEGAGRSLADRFGVPWYPTLDDFGVLDALIVAAPTALHTDWAVRALEQDCPTLVEKPLAPEFADVEILVAAADKAGVPLMCGLLERYNPAVRTALDIAEAPIHVSTVRHSPYVPRIPTGVAQDLLIHDVDLVLRLAAGAPSQVFARFGYFDGRSRSGAEDLAEVTCDFGGSLIASLSASRLSHRKVRSLAITEADRLIEVDMVRSDITIYRHVGSAPLDDDAMGYRQQTIIDIPAIHDAREPLATQLERFLSLVQGEEDWREELETLAPPHALLAQITEIATADPALDCGAS